MRRAWKVRLAGWPPVDLAAAGMAPATTSTSRREDANGSPLPGVDDGARDPVCEPLLPVLPQDSGQFGDGVGVVTTSAAVMPLPADMRMSSGASTA